jgi:hypothetical protein
VTSIKLFKGSPNDLPPFIRDHFFGPQLNFNLSIGVELSCAFLALLHPRWGFAALSALMSFFVGVLLYLISQGATSCGCFGGAIKFPPWAMLSVDGSLLAFMLLTKPWSSIRKSKAPLALIGFATVVAFAAPWLLISTKKVAPPSATVDGSASAVWQLPAKPWPRYVDLPVEKWVGKPIRETELGPWIDTSVFPSENNRWVIYLHSCEHCRDYLRKLYNENPIDLDLVLIEIKDDRPRVVDLVPQTDWKAELSAEIQWVISPPWELLLRGGVVQEAHFRAEE